MHPYLQRVLMIKFKLVLSLSLTDLRVCGLGLKSTPNPAGKSPDILGKPMSKSSDGRLVWNHSTHLPGLIKILEKLTSHEGITTITPAVIGRTRANAHHIQIKISIPIRGGFKLIARKGKTFQEVFIVTTLSQLELAEAIAQVMP